VADCSSRFARLAGSLASLSRVEPLYPVLQIDAYPPAGGLSTISSGQSLSTRDRQTTNADANLIKNVIIKYPGYTLPRMLF
jgi:hypothetical protein